ncbi:hypothetical protein R5R35_000171 [Gryllus longicercus]|uniref:Regulatory protein zeste n=1 Tax=Gryllus longicercus TaxID=2509291 RepID=A0AAN9VZR2_9ORTH
MARYEKSERGLLAEICQKYPIMGDKGYGGDILKKKKVAWQKIASEFNSSTPGRAPRTEEQIRGLWKRLKISTKEKIDAMRSEARKTGGGPSSNLNLDPAEEIVSGMLGSSVDPLPMDHDNDAVGFQEGQILVEMGEGVVVEEAVPEMVVEDVPPENERRSAPVPQKNKKSLYDEQLLQMAEKEHLQRLSDDARRMQMAAEKHELEMQILQLEKKIKIKILEQMQM